MTFRNIFHLDNKNSRTFLRAILTNYGLVASKDGGEYCNQEYSHKVKGSRFCLVYWNLSTRTKEGNLTQNGAYCPTVELPLTCIYSNLV